MVAERAERSKATWSRVPSPEERAAELARYELLTSRDIRRAFVFAIAVGVFWLAAGLVLMGWALHTTDRADGEIAFLAGLLIGYTGIVVTLAMYHRRGQQAGWW